MRREDVGIAIHIQAEEHLVGDDIPLSDSNVQDVTGRCGRLERIIGKR